MEITTDFDLAVIYKLLDRIGSYSGIEYTTQFGEPVVKFRAFSLQITAFADVSLKSFKVKDPCNDIIVVNNKQLTALFSNTEPPYTIIYDPEKSQEFTVKTKDMKFIINTIYPPSESVSTPSDDDEVADYNNMSQSDRYRNYSYFRFYADTIWKAHLWLDVKTDEIMDSLAKLSMFEDREVMFHRDKGNMYGRIIESGDEVDKVVGEKKLLVTKEQLLQPGEGVKDDDLDYDADDLGVMTWGKSVKDFVVKGLAAPLLENSVFRLGIRHNLFCLFDIKSAKVNTLIMIAAQVTHTWDDDEYIDDEEVEEVYMEE
jgi:hypothetical protein